MTLSPLRADFYLIKNQQTEAALLQAACRILEKAFQRQQQVYVQLASTQQAQRLDDQLWTFRDGAFIPHAQYRVGMTADSEAIQIGCEPPPPHQQQILLNLCGQIPENIQQFARIIEIVLDESRQRELARERYKFYRDQGMQLHSHEIFL